jgi:transcriptional antiterminator RfaH
MTEEHANVAAGRAAGAAAHGPAWHVVEAYTGWRGGATLERRAERHLRDQGFDAFLPLFPCARRVRGALVTQMAALFPGYLFVRFDPARASWRSINGTVGVRRLILIDEERPASVPDADVERIRKYVEGLGAEFEASGRRANHRFKSGQRVRVTEGWLKGLEGLCQRASADRVTVLLDILGQSGIGWGLKPAHLQPVG